MPKIIKPALFRMGFIFSLLAANTPVLVMWRLDVLAHSGLAIQPLDEASLVGIGILGVIFLEMGVKLLRLSTEFAQKNEKGTDV